jgi:PAS domain-containing protein
VIRGTPGEQPPIVVVTGSPTEDAAVECIRAGAEDYLLKDRPGRLAQAVRQAIERRRLQKSRTVLEDSLSETEDRLSAVVQSMDDIVVTLDPEGRLTGFFGPWVAREGLNAKVFLRRSVREIVGPPADDQRLWLERARRGESVRGEWSFIQAGGRRTFDYTISPLRRGADRELIGLLVVGRETTAVRAATKAMMDAQTEVISRLLLAAEFRDDDTSDHVARMSHYASASPSASGVPLRTRGRCSWPPRCTT